MSAPARRPRRFAALVRAETMILLRNRTALVTAVLMPLVLAVLFVGVKSMGLDLGPMLAVSIIGMGLLLVVYYTMVSSLVARREQLVLKRLLAGEASRLEILLAPAVPLWGILVVQSALGVGLAVALLGTGVVHWWALPLAVLGGAAAWTTIAVASANLTRTVESAQLTTMPLLLVSIMLSGLSLPLSILPDALERAAHWLPLTPVVDLIVLGFTGAGADGTAPEGPLALLGSVAGMLLPLAAWAVAALVEGLRHFRWDARG